MGKDLLKFFFISIPSIAIAGAITTWLMDNILNFLIKNKIIKLKIIKTKEIKEYEKNEFNK